MAKTRTKYVCSECGRQTPRYMGRCPNCGEFNTMVEEVEEVTRSSATAKRQPTGAARNAPERLAEISSEVGDRLFVPIEEFSRVLGGGIVPGSIILLGGDPGIGKCLTGDTRIFDPASGSYRPIEALHDQNSQVLALDDEKLKFGQQPVIAFHEQGKKEVFEVTTKLGRRLSCTANHPLLTTEGWMPLENLAIGSYIAAPRLLPYFGNETLPETHVKLIAYILSDGSAGSQFTVTSLLPEVEANVYEIADAFGMTLKRYRKSKTEAKQYRFTITHGSREIARQEFAEALRTTKKELNISRAEWARRANVDYAMLRVWDTGEAVPDAQTLEALASAVNIPIENLAPEARSQAEKTPQMAYFLDSIGLRYKHARTKFVPDCIFSLPPDQLALFLKILFSCDGSVYIHGKSTPAISYSTISHRLAQDIQHLLLRFGFVARLRTKHSRVNTEKYVAYELQLLGVAEVKRFLDEIGIMGRDKAKAIIEEMEIPSLPSTHRDVIPTGELFWNHLIQVCGNNFAEITRQIGTKLKNRRHERPLTRYLVEKIATVYPDPRLQALAFGDVYWDEIVTIEPAGKETVYDISVAEHANFVANDLVVHNSTLTLQLTSVLAQDVGKVLYVSGEESTRQIKMRADRLGLKAEDLYLLTETNLGNIFEYIYELSPTIVVIDSIQTVYTDDSNSSPGSVTQVRECASRLQGLAKSSGTSVFLIGHVTKEGSIAGPRVLEHIVDTVLYLEGDQFQSFRLLRSVKNRFGATNEVGVFEMQQGGMVEVPNPSEAFLAERVVNAPGSAIAVTMEGTRPLLVELQALTSPTSFGNPRRTPNGVDFNRMLLISAVMSKRVGLRLHEHDIFINVIGGLKVSEPASDLAMAMAIASSYFDVPIAADLVIIGEVGLSGELRTVSQIAMRLNEAAKMGFKRALLPKTRRKLEDVPPGMELLQARGVAEALNIAVPKT